MIFLKLVLILFLIWPLVGCSHLLYYPSSKQFYDPKDFKIPYSSIDIPFGKRWIHSWYFKNPRQEKSKGTIIFFHGNAENLTSHFSSLLWVLNFGYDYLIFDYPGYGNSPGEPNPKSTVEAGKAVLHYVHEKIDSRPLIIYGHSLGGIIALRTAETQKELIPIQALIIDSSFSSYQDVARSAMAQSWITWLLQPLAYVLFSDAEAPQDLSSFSPIPLVFITGDRDQTVSPTHSQNMYKEAMEPKKLWIVKEGTHGSSFISEKGRVRTELIQYLDNLKPDLSLQKK